MAAIDDYEENYELLVAAGATTYLADQRWNRHLAGANRVADLRHFAYRVLDVPVPNR